MASAAAAAAAALSLTSETTLHRLQLRSSSATAASLRITGAVAHATSVMRQLQERLQEQQLRLRAQQVTRDSSLLPSSLASHARAQRGIQAARAAAACATLLLLLLAAYITSLLLLDYDALQPIIGVTLPQ
jgi:Flp pilus assembly protein TadB